MLNYVRRILADRCSIAECSPVCQLSSKLHVSGSLFSVEVQYIYLCQTNYLVTLSIPLAMPPFIILPYPLSGNKVVNESAK